MERRELRETLLVEIQSVKNRIGELNRHKGEAEGARTSWSSHQTLDIEQEVAQYEARQIRLQELLTGLDQAIPSDIVGLGSIVAISLGGDTETYLILDGKGGKIGDYFILSVRSPIGKAVLGKRLGDKFTAMAPQGRVQVEILKVA